MAMPRRSQYLPLPSRLRPPPMSLSQPSAAPAPEFDWVVTWLGALVPTTAQIRSVMEATGVNEADALGALETAADPRVTRELQTFDTMASQAMLAMDIIRNRQAYRAYVRLLEVDARLASQVHFTGEHQQ